MFPSPIDLTVPDPWDQVRIVSRIAPAVASEAVRWRVTSGETKPAGKHLITWHSPSVSDVLMELP
jgi:hypothetical protein